MSGRYKVIGADQREYGPVELEELRRWLAEGRVNAATLAQREGESGWSAVSTLPELAAVMAATPPAFPVMQPIRFGAVRTNGLAIAGFVLSLLNFCCCCCGPLFAVLGLIFSCIALVEIKRNPGQRGLGLAVAGIVLAILGLFFSGMAVLLSLAESAVHGR